MQFPKSFFEKEEREGFAVSEMMKRAWAAEMEVLAVVDEVCKANHIRYYACFGTLLGAVRHHGFIPWDDDIDICMLRPDYERFIEIAGKSLPEGYVISGMYAADDRLFMANGESQLRVIADETVFTLPIQMNTFHAFPYPRVGIDIFPLDRLPDDISEQIRIVSEINDLQYTSNHWKELADSGKLEERLLRYDMYFGIHFDRSDECVSRRSMQLKIDEIASSAWDSSSELVANILYLHTPVNPDGFPGYRGYREEWFGEPVIMPYETGCIPVPKEYDEVLKKIYGPDYMTPKPFTGLHNYPFYAVQEQEFVKLLKESGVDTPVDEFCSNWHNMIGGT